MANKLDEHQSQINFLANFITEALYIPQHKKPEEKAQQESTAENKEFQNIPHQNTEEASDIQDHQKTQEPSSVYKPSADSQAVKEGPYDSIGKIGYFGEFRQSVVLLVNYQLKVDLIKKDQLVLQQILKALSLKFEDVAVINIGKHPGLTSDELFQILNPKQVIGFNIAHNFLNSSAALYEPQELQNGIQILLADDLSLIARQRKLKKQLWQGLKGIFQIS